MDSEHKWRHLKRWTCHLYARLCSSRLNWAWYYLFLGLTRVALLDLFNFTDYRAYSPKFTLCLEQDASPHFKKACFWLVAPGKCRLDQEAIGFLYSLPEELTLWRHTEPRVGGGETVKLDLWLTGVTVTHTEKIWKRKIIDELYMCIFGVAYRSIIILFQQYLTFAWHSTGRVKLLF